MSSRAKRDSSTWLNVGSIRDFTFSVHWSNDEDAFVGTCDDFPPLSHLSTNPSGALYGIMDLVLDVVTEMSS